MPHSNRTPDQQNAYLLGHQHGYQDGHGDGFREATRSDAGVFTMVGLLGASVGWVAHAVYWYLTHIPVQP